MFQGMGLGLNLHKVFFEGHRLRIATRNVAQHSRITGKVHTLHVQIFFSFGRTSSQRTRSSKKLGETQNATLIWVCTAIPCTYRFVGSGTPGCCLFFDPAFTCKPSKSNPPDNQALQSPPQPWNKTTRKYTKGSTTASLA